MIGHDTQLTLKIFLDYGLLYNPCQIIKYKDEFQYTYTEHFNRVKKLANALKLLGVEPGQAVGFIEYDSHRYLEAYWAIPLSGCALHTINIRMSLPQMIHCINQAEDVVLFINKDFIPVIEKIKDRLQTVKTYVIMSDDREQAIATTLDNTAKYEELLAKAEADYVFPEISEDTPATICFTSGTTGNPKGVVLTHRQLCLHTMFASMTWGLYPHSIDLKANQTYLPLTPMFHVQAWGMPYIAFMLGDKIIMPGKYECNKILKWVAEEHVNFSHCVPTVLQKLLTNSDIDKYDLSHWRVVVGGSKLPQALAQRAHELGIFTQTGYGMTETGPAMTTALLKPEHFNLSSEEKLAYLLKSGIPFLGAQLKVVDSNNQEVPRDGQTYGNVLFRSPWCTHQYLKEEAATEQLWENGWLNTGDLGFIDSEGYLIVTDRLKDVVKSGGEWISTLALEDCISSHPEVEECAVIGISDPIWGERPCAFIVLKDGKLSSAQEISWWLLQNKLSEIKKHWIPDIPKGYIFVDEIPHNQTGKIDKQILRKIHNSLENSMT